LIGLYVGFIALILFGGVIWYTGSTVVDEMATIVSTAFPSSWSGADSVFLTFLRNWWHWLGLFMLLGGVYWLIVNTQRIREAARYA